MFLAVVKQVCDIIFQRNPYHLHACSITLIAFVST